MYDQREKAQRDYEWALSGAREEGERLGMEKGELVGKVRLLQELLGLDQNSTEELRTFCTETLTDRLADLQQRLRERQA